MNHWYKYTTYDHLDLDPDWYKLAVIDKKHVTCPYCIERLSKEPNLWRRLISALTRDKR